MVIYVLLAGTTYDIKWEIIGLLFAKKIVHHLFTFHGINVVFSHERYE